MTSHTRGSMLLKLLNCLLLVSVVVLLVYTAKITSDLHEEKETNGRVKRSTHDRGDIDQDEIELPDLDSAHIQLVLNGNGNPQQLLWNITGGAIYTRWGRTECDAPGTELVYSGIAGGSHYDHTGGGSNYICLPMDPLWGSYQDAAVNHAIVYGAEYELQANDFPFSSSNAQKLQDHNVPCAVCHINTRGTVLMIPARNECYDGWTEQYHGYLMAGAHAHKGIKEFVCVDENPESDPAGYRNENGALFYSAEGACGSLPCPPYVNGRELTCVVCSK